MLFNFVFFLKVACTNFENLEHFGISFNGILLLWLIKKGVTKITEPDISKIKNFFFALSHGKCNNAVFITLCNYLVSYCQKSRSPLRVDQKFSNEDVQKIEVTLFSTWFSDSKQKQFGGILITCTLSISLSKKSKTA